MFANGELVEILRAQTEQDEYHNNVEVWSDPPQVVDSDPSAGVEPRPLPIENTNDRNAITDGFTLYLRPGIDVRATDRVRVRGEVWAVQGQPADWRSPFTGWRPGVVIQVGRTDG